MDEHRRQFRRNQMNSVSEGLLPGRLDLFWGRFRISSRLAALLLLPLLGFICAMSIAVEEAWQTERRMADVANLAEVAGAVGNLVTGLQQEAGASAAFVTSKGTQKGEALPTLRTISDKAVAAVESAVTAADFDRTGGQAVLALRQVQQALEQLGAKRRLVDGLTTPVGEINDYYTPVIGQLLTVNLEMLNVIKSPEVGRATSAYVYLLWFKEAASATRANGVVGFNRGFFMPEELARVQNFVGWQSVYGKLFNLYATPDQRTFLDRTVRGPLADAALRMQQLAITTPPNGKLGTDSSDDWFKAASARVDLMTEVEKKLQSDFLLLAKSAKSDAGSRLYTSGLISLVLLVVTGLLSFSILRALTRSIAAITGAMDRVASGSFDDEVPYRTNRDEIGSLARALDVFKQNSIAMKRLETDQASLKQQTERERKASLFSMAEEFETQIGGLAKALSGAATEMQAAANSMSTTTDEANRQSSAVAAAAEEASANVQTVASAAEELAASIKEIGHRVSESRDIAKQAIAESQTTSETVRVLSESANSIGEVVQLISSIAAQTNLLALNATIEAARAGETGKGFAVVASEVKSLANQTAQATKSIEGQISEIQALTAKTVGAIANITQIVASMSDLGIEVAAAIEQQGATTAEIARNVNQAAKGTEDVSANIGSVHVAAATTKAAAEQILGSSSALSHQTASLNAEVDKFLTGVRAA
jgi:methyl-accepting chemotaxis protein